MDALWPVCRRCGDVLPESELTPDERDEWRQAHLEQTGHDDWERRQVAVD